LFFKIYEPKYAKAALCLQKEPEELMAFLIFRPSIGKVFVPAIQLNRLLPQSATAQSVLKGGCRGTECGT
jgi:hypothetical protein